MITPVTEFSESGSLNDIKVGHSLLEKGAMGTIILAGGMGTRLGFPHPKGLFPLSVVKQKSLFQIFAEKTLAASRQAKQDLLLAIMTSKENDFETRNFFAAHQNFGLKSSQLFFFSQSETFLEDTNGNTLALRASDGNGSVFESFVTSGLYQEWQNQNIEYLNIILVDNALADPYDANLLGFHASTQADVTLKVIQRKSSDEKVGLLVKRDDQLAVIEYSEMGEPENSSTNADGSLTHTLANISLFCLSMPFVKQLSQAAFPWHKALKPLTQLPHSPLIIKKERFIFDLLAFAKNPQILNYSRENCFAPLKNKTGNDSVETAQELIENYDRKVLSKLFNKSVLIDPLEIAAEFHYPTEEMKAHWQRQEPSFEDHYIS